MPGSLISHLLSDWTGRTSPDPGTSSQDCSGLSAPRMSATRRVGRLSMETDPRTPAPGQARGRPGTCPGTHLIAVAMAGCWPAGLSWSAFVSLQNTAHDPHGPMILLVDPVLSQPSRPSHPGLHSRQLEFPADPAEGSHLPVQFILVLRAVSLGSFCLVHGLECLARQVGYQGGIVDCPLFPAGSGLFR
jgi:hypothetical protein